MRHESVLGGFALGLTCGRLCNAAVVVVLHLDAKHLRVHQREDVVTNFLEFRLHFRGSPSLAPPASRLPLISFVLLHTGRSYHFTMCLGGTSSQR